MWVRRALFWWQGAAIIVLPALLLVMRGIIGSQIGWDFLLYLVLCGILGMLMLVVCLLTSFRVSVWRSRAVGPVDAVVIVVWHAAIIGFAFLESVPLAVLVVIAGIAAFWIALVQLVLETGKRMRNAVRDFGTEFSGVRSQMRGDRSSVSIGEIIVIQPADDSDDT